ncbi:MAG: Clp protease N-terminal domain-containing protein [Bryobacteraceae bacterium]
MPADEADREDSHAITPKHLLIGILRLPGSLGAKILAGHGITERDTACASLRDGVQPEERPSVRSRRRVALPLVRRRNVCDSLTAARSMAFFQAKCGTCAAEYNWKIRFTGGLPAT